MDEAYRNQIKNFDTKNYRYFARTDHAEIRLVKNVKIDGERLKLQKLKTPVPLPDPPKVYDGELYFGHYQYRNPEQIKTRLATRKKAIDMGSPSFHFYTKKWGMEDWDPYKLFIPERKLSKYDYIRPFTMRGVKLQRMNTLFFRLFNPRKPLRFLFKYIFKK
jgi:hypothetical protein